ncbi:MAG: hypothetical protein QM796_17525 [Chthoniobacteraceae bacterium]
MTKRLLGFAAALCALISTASAIVPTGQIYEPVGTITIYHSSTQTYETVPFKVKSLLKLAGVSNVSPRTVVLVLANNGSGQNLYLLKKDGSAEYAKIATLSSTDSIDTAHKSHVKQAGSVSFFDGGPGALLVTGVVNSKNSTPKSATVIVTAAGAVDTDTAFIKGKLIFKEMVGITVTLD